MSSYSPSSGATVARNLGAVELLGLGSGSSAGELQHPAPKAEPAARRVVLAEVGGRERLGERWLRVPARRKERGAVRDVGPALRWGRLSRDGLGPVALHELGLERLRLDDLGFDELRVGRIGGVRIVRLRV